MINFFKNFKNRKHIKRLREIKRNESLHIEAYKEGYTNGLNLKRIIRYKDLDLEFFRLWGAINKLEGRKSFYD